MNELINFDWSSLATPATDVALEVAKAQSKSLAGTTIDTIKSQWSKVDWRGSRNAYRENLLETLSTTKILGNPRSIKVEDIYTDVYVYDRLSALRRFSDDIYELNTVNAALFEGGPRLAALEIAETGEDLFILGRPGAGKTTFLKYLAILACRGRIKKTPIFISLKEWSDSSLSILPFIAKQFDLCGFPNAEPFVRALLERGDALILLDGLDEVNELQSKRSQTTKEIVKLSQKFKKCQFCLTCRTAATDYSFERFKYVEVADFAPEQQIQFVTQWYGPQSEYLPKFLSGWNDSQQNGLRELGKTPLLLTLLCLAFEETLKFPLRQVDLYKEAIDALLRKWDTSRLIVRDDFYKSLSYSRREHLLELIAARFYFDSKTAFKKSALERVVLEFLRGLPDKEKPETADAALVIGQIEAQHGLIVERALGIYTFSHLTLQEYFTAAHLVQSHQVGLIDQVVDLGMRDQKWREVVLFTSSLMPAADTILLKMADKLKEMRGSDPGVLRFLGYCLCEARLRDRKRNDPEPFVGHRRASELKDQIYARVISSKHPALTGAETTAIAEHFIKIRSFLKIREDKYEFGIAAKIVSVATDLITQQPSKAATLLGGYFVRPESFISYLYACRLMIECLEVAVSQQRSKYIDSIMAIGDAEIRMALA